MTLPPDYIPPPWEQRRMPRWEPRPTSSRVSQGISLGVFMILSTIIVVLVTIIFLMWALRPAHAADMKLCDVWAKAVVRTSVDMSPLPDIRAKQDAYRTAIHAATYSQCLLAEADAQWEETMQQFLADMGTEPAQPAIDHDWVVRCKADYRSFRESDGTVIRRGSRKRVRCPS